VVLLGSATETSTDRSCCLSMAGKVSDEGEKVPSRTCSVLLAAIIVAVGVNSSLWADIGRGLGGIVSDRSDTADLE